MVRRLPFVFAAAALALSPLGCSSGDKTCCSSKEAATASDVTRESITVAMRRVADWQIAHPSKHVTTDWTQAPYFSGLMALYRVSDDAKYLDAMIGFGEKNDWKLGPKVYHADDHAVGKAYLEVYALKKDPRMIADLKARFDGIITTPPADSENLRINRKGGTDVWSWCDALYMAPPAWTALSAATGDARHLGFSDREFWRVYEFLYDKKQHLFYRDCKYFDSKEANGASVFWGRGNGWVIAGLADILKTLPKDHPSRPKYEQLMREMAEKLVECQQPDGAWRASLLDPASFPKPEMSSTGLISYGVAYAVNNGLVGRAKFKPALDKAWACLTAHILEDGKLGSIQPIGESPKNIKPTDTEVYGVGAFLQFGEEYLKLIEAK